MKKLTVILLTGITVQCFAINPLDGLVTTAQNEAAAIKMYCIDAPPVTSPQVIWCSGHYSVYVNDLTNLQLPKPLTLNTGIDGYISPYSSSLYDICRYEPGRVINTVICQAIQ